MVMKQINSATYLYYIVLVVIEHSFIQKLI